MADFHQHFERRGVADRLDVVSVLVEGLTDDRKRCPFAYDGREVGLAELRDRVAASQVQLRRAGMKSGQRVALMLNNSLDQIAIIFSLILSGIVWISINNHLRGAGLSYIFEHSQPDLLIFDDVFEAPVAELTGLRAVPLNVLLVAAPEHGTEPATAPGINPNDPLCIIYTSGTTGPAKGVVFTHRMLGIATEAALLVAAIRPGDRAFLWEPLCHVGGAQMLLVPFLIDAQLHVVRGFSASRFWEQWASARATHLHYLGGILDVLMQRPASEAPAKPPIRVAWGAGVSAQAWGPIRDRFGCELRECYGLTECSSFATLNDGGTPGSIGRPLPWIGLELLDEAGRPVAEGEIGEIVLSSDVEGVFLPGYLDDPDATREALKDGRLHTGDMARRLDYGEYAFVGRRTDSMRVRGENVSAWEVERVFAGHPAIRAAAAVGVAGTIGEQEIALYVQFEGAAVVDWDDIVAWARPRLAAFQLPRYYVAVEAFDLTPSERIRKHLLPRTVGGAWDRVGAAAKRSFPMASSTGFIVAERRDTVGVVRLDRPEKLNACTAAMRGEIVEALEAFEADASCRAIVMTGTGDRAFCADQDLGEAHGFSVDEAEAWIRGWGTFYSALRGLSKPLVVALNGLAAGSAFQAALMGDVRVGHPRVRMGQPEINAGIASITGPWIMNLMLGMSRTVEITLSGRLMDADECLRVGLIHHLVEAEAVFERSVEIARELGAKPEVAMRLDKARFHEMTEPSFADTIEAAVRYHRASYERGEPARMMEKFYRARGGGVRNMRPLRAAGRGLDCTMSETLEPVPSVVRSVRRLRAERAASMAPWPSRRGSRSVKTT